MRRAIISGASRGIGAAIAKSLGAHGFRIVIGYRHHKDAAAAVVQTILDCGGEALAIKIDVADASAVANALIELDYQKDPFDVVVNNAAIVRDSLLANMSYGDWRLVLDTTLDGFFNLTQPLVLPMVRRRWGRIVISFRTPEFRAIEVKSIIPRPRAGSSRPPKRWPKKLPHGELP